MEKLNRDCLNKMSSAGIDTKGCQPATVGSGADLMETIETRSMAMGNTSSSLLGQTPSHSSD
jgi:hypothetical protein